MSFMANNLKTVKLGYGTLPYIYFFYVYVYTQQIDVIKIAKALNFIKNLSKQTDFMVRKLYATR